jgi:hypothetical protein
MQKFKRKILAAGLSLMLILSLALTAQAIDIQKPDFLPGPDLDQTPIGQETQNYILNEAIGNALNIGIGILGLSAFIGLLIGAITFLTAYGNEDKINRGKTILKNSLLGFLLITLSYAIISIVVAIAIPSEDIVFRPQNTLQEWLIPSAHAVDDTDLNILLPPQSELIEGQNVAQDVSLVSGDLITQIVPAVVSNILFSVGFLLFISFMYGGGLLVINRGSEESVTKAKSIMTYSVVALAVISLGYALVFGIATFNFNNDESTDQDDVFTETDLNS